MWVLNIESMVIVRRFQDPCGEFLMRIFCVYSVRSKFVLNILIRHRLACLRQFLLNS